MKKASIFKVLAFGLVLVMMLTLFVGCGGGGNNSSAPNDPVNSSVDDDDFTDIGDYDYEGSGGGSQGDSSGNTTAAGKNNKTTTAGKNNKATTTKTPVVSDGGGTHVDMSDNTDVFKNIPAELVGKTVLFADWGEALADRYQLVCKKFTEDTGIKVKTVLYEEGNFITNVAQQIAAGKSPDIAATNNWFPQALEIVDPLPSIFNTKDGFWDPRVSAATAVNGKEYFVNTYNSPFTGGYVVYYNKKIFNNYGVKSPQDYLNEGNWTYENLYKCMQEAGEFCDQGGILEALTIYGQSGKSIINYDPNTGKFFGTSKDPMLTASVKFMVTAVEEGLAGGYGIGAFASGKIAICMAGTYGTKYNGYFKDMSPADIGVVPCPTSYEGKALNYMPLGYRGYGICKGAKNGEAAYYFLRYFLDMDKYEGAGANIFANKVLEKYFRETQLTMFQKSQLTFEMFNGPFALAGTSWGGGDWSPVRNAAPSAVATELEARDNLVQNAVNKANEKLAASV